MFGTLPPHVPVAPTLTTADALPGPSAASTSDATAAAGTHGGPGVGSALASSATPSLCQRLQGVIRGMEDRVPVTVRLDLNDLSQSLLTRVPLGVEPTPGVSSEETKLALAACAGDVTSIARQLAVVKDQAATVLDSDRLTRAWRCLCSAGWARSRPGGGAWLGGSGPCWAWGASPGPAAMGCVLHDMSRLRSCVCVKGRVHTVHPCDGGRAR